MTIAITADALRAAPKVLLHDHLDGGLRPQTVLDLAAEVGHELPASDAESLGRWFAEAADSGSLPRYLETFDHTVAVMQTADAIRRVARECVLDLAADGVVYAESRFAPEQHQQRGLTLDEVVEAAVAGYIEGEELAREQGRFIRVGCLVTAMRHADRWQEIAELTVRFRGRGVVGFDIAGAELGFPADRHVEAFDYLRSETTRFTVHAGEADGIDSVRAAVGRCGADRIGHGVRITEDISGDELGHVAHYVRDRGTALELCPSSNVQTGAVASLDAHPFRTLDDLGFRVTVNTDNRLMSGTTMTKECGILADRFGYGWDDLERLAVTAIDASFAHVDLRDEIVDEIIRPWYDEARG